MDGLGRERPAQQVAVGSHANLAAGPRSSTPGASDCLLSADGFGQRLPTCTA